jgi:hypothetical protein
MTNFIHERYRPIHSNTYVIYGSRTGLDLGLIGQGVTFDFVSAISYEHTIALVNSAIYHKVEEGK